jgi:hypothetical protein
VYEYDFVLRELFIFAAIPGLGGPLSRPPDVMKYMAFVGEESSAMCATQDIWTFTAVLIGVPQHHLVIPCGVGVNAEGDD